MIGGAWKRLKRLRSLSYDSVISLSASVGRAATSGDLNVWKLKPQRVGCQPEDAIVTTADDGSSP